MATAMSLINSAEVMPNSPLSSLGSAGRIRKHLKALDVLNALDSWPEKIS
jgi:hypothetical protein